MTTITILAVDLVGYSAYVASLDAAGGAGATQQFDQSIEALIHAALGAARDGPARILQAAGDGAVVALATPADAHRVAAAVHAAAAARTAECRDTHCGAVALWFRSGAATGAVSVARGPGGADRYAGFVIARAVRLEAAARPGCLLIDAPTYAGLPRELAAGYDPPAPVAGKRDERFPARGREFTPGGPAPAAGADDRLKLFALLDRLTTLSDLARTCAAVELPPPDGDRTLDEQRVEVVRRAAAAGRLRQLGEVLESLAVARRARVARARGALALTVALATVAALTPAATALFTPRKEPDLPAREAPPPAAGSTCRLIVRSQTTPVEVFVDGRLLLTVSDPGSAPAVEVPPGRHEISARARDREWRQTLTLGRSYLLKIPGDESFGPTGREPEHGR